VSVVEARGLVKSYGAVEAVRGVDFAIREGECYGFLGPNGAGKSTTMKLISCRIAASAGSLRVLGWDAAAPGGGPSPHWAAIKAQLGVVAQETALDPELTVFENLVQYGLYFGIGLRGSRARARELLDFVQLETKAGAMVSELSGGMKRRLMLARALVNRPRLLVLDEPTAGLDPQARLAVWERLHALRRDGVTILLTTHDMDEAARLCDRLAIVHQGRILREGTPEALVRDGVEPQVLELPLGSAAAARAAALGSALGARLQPYGGRLYCYSADAAALLRHIEDGGAPAESRLIRPATLEDLFLRLTGVELAE
jgi:lipooligosaccharide transport system ATP-binding protein